MFTRGAEGLIGVSDASVRGIGGPTLLRASGVDADFFQAAKGDGDGFRRRAEIPEGTTVLFYPSRYERRKNQQFLISIAEKLKIVPGMKPFCFVLMGRVGEPAYLEKIRHLVQRRDLEPYFRFLGPGNAAEVRDGYAAADVVVFPSRREGLGLIALEAMAMQKPVVASDIPGLNEVVREGIDGYLVRSNDASSVVGALIKLINNPDLRRSFGNSGRQHVETQWRLEDAGMKHLDLYSSLAGRMRSSRLQTLAKTER
jgi:glycosyltransferase involved in cell wall biosynthesis